MSGSALLAGYGADMVCGDPPRWHPVAGIGRVAGAVERRAWAPRRSRGAGVTGLLVGAVGVGAELLARRMGRRVVLALVTWAALGGRSLRREAVRVAALAQDGNLPEARRELRTLCGRDAAALDGDGIARAVVESVAENTSDAVVGALLWGTVAGPAGVALYRTTNTLDAMFGHRSPRYAAFGWAAARLDDLLNWPAARLTAVLTCLAAPLVGGSPAATWRVLARDGGAHPSPNAGRAEAAFAGALGVTLGGPLAYGGRGESRPRLGDGPPPAIDDVARAVRLSAWVCGSAALLCAGVRVALERRRS